MEIVGTIEEIFDTKTFGEKEFKKRELILNTDGEYPQYLSIEFQQEKTSILDKYNIGDQVEVSINLRGRKWEGPDGTKYFNTIQGWKINKVDPFA